jgi:hypothetical protein
MSHVHVDFSSEMSSEKRKGSGRYCISTVARAISSLMNRENRSAGPEQVNISRLPRAELQSDEQLPPSNRHPRTFTAELQDNYQVKVVPVPNT